MDVFRRLAACVPNIILPRTLYYALARPGNKLKSELKCFEQLLRSDIAWSYGINLLTSAFPLRNHSHVAAYLRAKEYGNELDYRTGDDDRFRNRTRYVHRTMRNRTAIFVARTFNQKSPPPTNLTLFRKGEHFIGTRAFYDFLTSSAISRSLLAWAMDTKFPEDFFYATLHRHPAAPHGDPYLVTESRDPYMSSAHARVNIFEYRKHNQRAVSSSDDEDVDVRNERPGGLLLTLWSSDKVMIMLGYFLNMLVG